MNDRTSAMQNSKTLSRAKNNYTNIIKVSECVCVYLILLHAKALKRVRLKVDKEITYNN